MPTKKATPAKKTSPKPKAAKKPSAASKRTTAGLLKEAATLAQIQRVTGLALLVDTKSRQMPYRHSGRNFQADAVWIAPAGSRYKGICLELQGIGKHTRVSGLRIDHVKGAIAQRGGWLWWASTYPGLTEMLPHLIELVEMAQLHDCLDENDRLL